MGGSYGAAAESFPPRARGRLQRGARDPYFPLQAGASASKAGRDTG